MEDRVQSRHHKDTEYIFLHLYSLHSDPFPNNKLKRILGSFTASSIWIFPLRFFYLAVDDAQLPSMQIHPDKWLGLHEMHGPRLQDETIVSMGVLGLYKAPKGEEKWQMYNSNLQWRGTSTIPPGLLPYFCSLGRSSRSENQGLAVCTGTVNAPVSYSADVKSDSKSTEDISNQKVMHSIRCFCSFAVPFQPPHLVQPPMFNHEEMSWRNKRMCT